MLLLAKEREKHYSKFKAMADYENLTGHELFHIMAEERLEKKYKGVVPGVPAEGMERK